MVPFGSTCKLQNGRAFKPEEWSSSGTPIIRIQNLTDESKPFNYCDFEVEDRFHVNSGDLLFSWSGTPGTSFGAFFWNRGKGFLNQHIFRVDLDVKRVDKNYLRYAINSKLNFIIDQAHGGVGLKHITKGKLEAIEIPLPPLPEQKRIAAILDKADAIRRKRQQAIQLADDFLRAVFLDMFGDPVTNSKGWEVKSLGQISTFENGDRSSAYPSGDDLVTEGVLFLSTKNIVSDTLSLESCQYITEDKYMDLSRGKARNGDLIITLRGTLGSCCVFDCVHQKAFINAQMMIIRPGSGVGNIFLHDLLVSKAIKNHLQAIGQGAAVPQLTAKQLKELMLPIPPIQEQKKYESIRGSVLASIKKMQSESKESLFKAITQKAFWGEL
ncbi:MAG: restriction endonuclease subunit S [Marinospirillum sp.]|nr:restriction endonuclease subunit S [Marinospirillum sp.]